ncbi:hypothetical protein DFJ73DRAFT_955685, partial [Zopfochytrium polystomum]
MTQPLREGRFASLLSSGQLIPDRNAVLAATTLRATRPNNLQSVGIPGTRTRPMAKPTDENKAELREETQVGGVVFKVVKRPARSAATSGTTVVVASGTAKISAASFAGLAAGTVRSATFKRHRILHTGSFHHHQSTSPGWRTEGRTIPGDAQRPTRSLNLIKYITFTLLRLSAARCESLMEFLAYSVQIRKELLVICELQQLQQQSGPQQSLQHSAVELAFRRSFAPLVHQQPTISSARQSTTKRSRPASSAEEDYDSLGELHAKHRASKPSHDITRKSSITVTQERHISSSALPFSTPQLRYPSLIAKDSVTSAPEDGGALPLAAYPAKTSSNEETGEKLVAGGNFSSVQVGNVAASSGLEPPIQCQNDGTAEDSKGPGDISDWSSGLEANLTGSAANSLSLSQTLEDKIHHSCAERSRDLEESSIRTVHTGPEFSTRHQNGIQPSDIVETDLQKGMSQTISTTLSTKEQPPGLPERMQATTIQLHSIALSSNPHIPSHQPEHVPSPAMSVGASGA